MTTELNIRQWPTDLRYWMDKQLTLTEHWKAQSKTSVSTCVCKMSLSKRKLSNLTSTFMYSVNASHPGHQRTCPRKQKTVYFILSFRSLKRSLTTCIPLLTRNVCYWITQSVMDYYKHSHTLYRLSCHQLYNDENKINSRQHIQTAINSKAILKMTRWFPIVYFRDQWFFSPLLWPQT